jgi:hypothetical protein
MKAPKNTEPKFDKIEEAALKVRGATVAVAYKAYDKMSDEADKILSAADKQADKIMRAAEKAISKAEDKADEVYAAAVKVKKDKKGK